MDDRLPPKGAQRACGRLWLPLKASNLRPRSAVPKPSEHQFQPDTAPEVLKFGTAVLL